MTFAEDIEQAAGAEKILAISVAANRGFVWRSDEPDHSLGSDPVEWSAARPVLDYNYETGYGGQDCHDFWAWTETRVLFVHEYDGATSIGSAPRFPVAFTENTAAG